MFSQLRMREEQALLAQDYALETARAEGIEKGLERGKVEGRVFAFLDMVRQGLLTSEVAGQQLGMTVAEFEALLSGHILNSRKLMKWQVLIKNLAIFT